MKRINRTGFTLIETIVAFAIIAIILVVALAGFNTISSIGNKAQAWNEADQEIETLIATGTGYTTSKDAALEFTITDSSNNPLVIKIEGKILTFDKGGKQLNVFQPNE